MSVYRFAYDNFKKNSLKKSSHSPGLPRHSHAAPAVNSVDCPWPVTLSGSLTGHWENEILTPPLLMFMSLSHPFHVVWQNQIRFEWVRSESLQQQSLINWLLFKKKILLEYLLWEFHVLRLCRRPPGLLREKSSTGASPRKQTQNQIECPRCSFTLHQEKPSPSADKQHSLPSKESGKHMWSSPRVKPQGLGHLWGAPLKLRSSAEPRLEQNKGKTLPKILSTHLGTFPTQHLQRQLRLSRLSPCGDFPPFWVSDSKFPSPNLRDPEQLHFCTLSYSCASSSPGHKHLCTSGLPWGLGFSGQPSTSGCRHSLLWEGFDWKIFNNF